MSLNMEGYKSKRKALIGEPLVNIRTLSIKTAFDLFMSDVGKIMSLSLAHFKLTGNIKESLGQDYFNGSLTMFYRAFQDYPEYQLLLTPYYEAMQKEINKETIFSFYKEAFRLANELDENNPEQREMYLSNRLVNISVVEFPFKDYSLYQFFYGSNDLKNELSKEISKIKILKSYDYYNGTDKPDNMSERVWRKRGKDWNKVIRRCGGYFAWTPSKGGKSVTIANYKDIDLDIEKIDLYLMTDEESAAFLAKKEILNVEYLNQLELTATKEGFENFEDMKTKEKEIPFHIYTDAFFDSNAILKELIDNDAEILKIKKIEILEKLKAL